VDGRGGATAVEEVLVVDVPAGDLFATGDVVLRVAAASRSQGFMRVLDEVSRAVAAPPTEGDS